MDEIEYDIICGGSRFEQQDSATRLVALYVCTIDGGTPGAQELGAFDLESTDGEIVLDRWNLDEPIRTGGAMADLRSTLEPFLAELFVELDRRSSQAEREAGLEFLVAELGIDAFKLYRQLVNE